MEVLGVICMLLLMGSIESQLIREAVATPNFAKGTARFSATLDCDNASSVYVAAITYNTSSCNCPTQPTTACPQDVAPSDLGNISAPCWTSPTCNVTFTTSPLICSSIRAIITYLCAPGNSPLTLNLESTATESLLTARYLASTNTASGALWECSVEARNCSSISVDLLLVIRNGNDRVSYFTTPGNRLGVMGVVANRWTFQTPFDVGLNVVPESALLNALLAVGAASQMTVTCGRRPTPEPNPSNNVSIVSTPPSSISGHELTAVHSSSGEERAGDWVCVVEVL